MEKIYAVVKPAHVGDSENPFICIDLVAILWHRAKYERVCGYSLGHDAKFFSDLNTAIKNTSRYEESAVVELEVDEQGQITAFGELYEYRGMREKFVQDDGSRFFSRVNVPFWDSRIIDEYTPGALAEMQRQFALSDLGIMHPAASAPPMEAIMEYKAPSYG